MNKKIWMAIIISIIIVFLVLLLIKQPFLNFNNSETENEEEEKITYTLTISVSGQGTTSPAVGNHVYDSGSTVSVTATADVGWNFNHWILDGFDAGSINPIEVSMDSNHTLEVVFVEETETEQSDYGPLNSYVQQLKNKGFEVSQGTWKEPQYYVEIPDLENFIKWAEKVREQHRQRGEDDPLIYVDIELSVFWFIGRIALFNYDDVTFYWFV